MNKHGGYRKDRLSQGHKPRWGCHRGSVVDAWIGHHAEHPGADFTDTQGERGGECTERAEDTASEENRERAPEDRHMDAGMRMTGSVNGGSSPKESLAYDCADRAFV